jgi:RNA polymerase sigma-70 factor (ECF subfamily)
MSTDAEIIDAVLAGSVDRYAELVSRYQSLAWKVAYGFVRNETDATELSQRAFVKAYERLRQFRREAKFSTWLYRILANECKDFFKHAARRPRGVSLDQPAAGEEAPLFEVADPHGDPRDAAANRELARHLAAAIEALGMKQRMAFVLHHLQGLSLEEVAEAMGCRVGTVKAHVFRATEALRVRFTSKEMQV